VVGASDKSVEAVPTQKLERFSTQHTEAGIVKWTLVGDTSTFHGSYVEVENPTVEIFEDGVVSITLKSQRGKQFLTGSEKDNLHLLGDVVGVSKDGTLYSEILHWQNRVGRLYGPDEVTLVRGDSTWVGTEMYANPTLETVKMKNNQFKLYPTDEKTDEYHSTPDVPE
jgi:LPS export ABC transporter protein LptC